VGLSIVLTLHNRAKYLRHNLESIRHFAPPPYPYEIVVVADSPSDDPLKVVSEFNDLPILYVEYSRLHPASNPQDGYCAFGLNLGVKLARFDAILKCDPEIVFTTNFFNVAPAMFHPDRLVFGTVIEAEQTFTDKVFENALDAQNKEQALSLGGKVELPPHGKPRLGILLFSKARFAAIGGIDEDFMRTPGEKGELEDWVERMLMSGAEGIWTNLLEGIHLWHAKPVLSGESWKLFELKKRARARTKEWKANLKHPWGDLNAIIKKIRVLGGDHEESGLATQGSPNG